MAVPNPKAPLGSGGRFAAIEQSAAASGARNPAAVAAAAGIKAHGKAQMAKYAAAGRKKKRKAKHPLAGMKASRRMIGRSGPPPVAAAPPAMPMGGVPAKPAGY